MYLKPSQVSAIMEGNQLDVMKDILYPVEKKYNPAFEHHKFNEQDALEDFSFEIGIDLDKITKMHEVGCHIINVDTILLIVCPFNVKELEIKEKYLIRAQYLLWVTDAKKCYIHVYHPDQTSVTESVEGDPEKIEKILNEISLFKERLEEVKNIDAETLANEYAELKAQIEMAQSRQKELLQDIVIKCGDKEAVINGMKLQKINRKGGVDYSKIPELRGVDLESYRKKSSEYWRLS